MILDRRVLPVASMAVLAPILAVPMPHSLVPVLVIASLWAALQAACSRQPVIDGAFVVTVLILALAAAATAGWSPDPFDAVSTALRIGGLALAGAILMRSVRNLDENERRVLVISLATGLAAQAIFLIVEYVGPVIFKTVSETDVVRESKSVANRSTSFTLLLAWPVCVALGRRVSVPLAFGLAVALVGAIAVSDNRTSKMAVMVGLVTLITLIRIDRAGAVVLRWLLVVVVLTAPLLTALIPNPTKSYVDWGWQHYSLHHRLTIWEFVGNKIAERPWIGWGMDASRKLPGGDVTIVVERPSEMGDQRSLQALPLHPHNAVLQVWLELGLPGAIGLIGLLWLVVGWASKFSSPVSRAAALTTVVVAMVIGGSSYGLWQGWWQASLWMTAIAMIGCLDNDLIVRQKG